MTHANSLIFNRIDDVNKDTVDFLNQEIGLYVRAREIGLDRELIFSMNPILLHHVLDHWLQTTDDDDRKMLQHQLDEFDIRMNRERK